MESAKALKKITIEPVTRVEGHGKVTILLDRDNRVAQARLHIVEFRGFERFILGRQFWELPVIVQRLCGICPVSHHLCAAKAVDGIVGAEKLTPTGEKMRRLMHYGQFFQSHALHFFHLCSPDLLFGFDSDAARRNIVAVAQAHPETARQGVLLRRFGQEVIRVTAGKRVHGTGSVPGGVNKTETRDERRLLAGAHPGSFSRADAMDRLRRFLVAGVTCFIDLTEPEEMPSYEALLPFSTPTGRRVEYFREPIRDHGIPANAECMKRALQLLDDALESGHTVYVHCRAGIGRSATVIGCWLGRHRRSVEAGLEELQERWRQSEASLSWPSVPETPEQVDYVLAWPVHKGRRRTFAAAPKLDFAEE